jgi:biotin transporter BioY
MRKSIITACLAGSAIIILGQFGFFEGFMMFLLAGAVPGTNYSVPSHAMYLAILGIISLIIVWFVGATVLEFFYKLSEKTLTKTKTTRKKLPKRRYSQI